MEPHMRESLIKFIKDSEFIVVDTETTGLNTRKDKIIGVGLYNGTESHYISLWEYNVKTEKLEAKPALECVKEVLQHLKGKKLIAFNWSFDGRMIKNSLGVDLIDDIHTDVLLLKHCCDENFPFGLKEIASNLFGHEVKAEKEAMKESIKANGGGATEYYKADPQLLMKYCLQDCLLTYKIYNHYAKDLKRQGLENFYYNEEVLPLYKTVTIPMEERGIRLNMAAVTEANEDIKADIEVLEHHIQKSIRPHLSLFTEWFLNKDYPPQTPKGKQPVWAKKGLTQLEAWQKDYPETSYMFNLLSKHHLKKLFFDTLKETPLNKTDLGSPQVDEEFLELMSAKYDWAAQLIVYNKLIKLKGTYIERFLEEQEDGIFYPSFMQHRTVSGRYAGDLQQLPRPIEPGV